MTSLAAGKDICAVCGKAATSMCTRCKAEKYCGQECQKAAWKVHKKLCGVGPQPPCAESAGAVTANGVAHGPTPNGSGGRPPQEPQKVDGPPPLCGTGYGRWLRVVSAIARPSQLVDTPEVGLTNPSNTCYLNAVLQCLLHTTMLRRNILAARPRPAEAWLSAFAELCGEVTAATDRLPGGANPRTVAPRRLAAMVASQSQEFAYGRQADAHEALMLILRELLAGCVAEGGQEASRFSMAQRGSKAYAARERLERGSLVGHVFGMEMGQTVRCRSCAYESSSSRVEYCLTLYVMAGLTEAELRRLAGAGTAARGHYGSYGGFTASEPSVPATSVEKLLEHQMRLEVIEDFSCEKCKKLGGYRTAFFQKRPNVLVVYINRHQDATLMGKLNRTVEFPLKLSLTSRDAMEGPPGGYFLYAVVVHIGQKSTVSGHYVAYIRDRSGNWHLLDDTRVARSSWSEVQGQHPYMLFYAADLVIFPEAEEPEQSAAAAEAPSQLPRAPAPEDARTTDPAADGTRDAAAASSPSEPPRAPAAEDAGTLELVADETKGSGAQGPATAEASTGDPAAVALEAKGDEAKGLGVAGALTRDPAAATTKGPLVAAAGGAADAEDWTLVAPDSEVAVAGGAAAEFEEEDSCFFCEDEDVGKCQWCGKEGRSIGRYWDGHERPSKS